MPTIQGIYQIVNILTNEIYVGSSINIFRRWADHRRELKKITHKNVLLQAAWEQYGEVAFLVTVLEQVEKRDDLIWREQHYLKSLQPAYNKEITAVRAPFRTWRNDEADKERFWSKVDQPTDGCWLWQGTLLMQGYGVFKIAGKMYKAHRLAYAYTHGEIPQGLIVCHACDNPRCVRPTHLFLGTTRDNMRDMSAKGRGYFNRPENKVAKVPPERHWCHLSPERQRGERNHNARLTQDQVEEIRCRYQRGGVSQAKLSGEYGVAQTTISAIIKRKLWR